MISGRGRYLKKNFCKKKFAIQQSLSNTMLFMFFPTQWKYVEIIILLLRIFLSWKIDFSIFLFYIVAFFIAEDESAEIEDIFTSLGCHWIFWENFLKIFKALNLELFMFTNLPKNGKTKYQKLLLFSNYLVSCWKVQILSKQFHFHWNFSLNCKWYWFQLIFTKLFQFRFWGWNQNFNQIFVG